MFALGVRQVGELLEARLDPEEDSGELDIEHEANFNSQDDVPLDNRYRQIYQ